MAINYETVREHCDKLLKEGQDINLKNLRNSIGSGSMTTLGPLLRQWKEDQEAKKQENAVGVPASLIDTITRAIQASMDEAVQHKTQDLQNELKNEKEDNSSYNKDLEEKEETIKNLQADYNAVNEAKSKLEGANDTLQKHADDLQQSLDAKSKEIEELRSDYKSSELVNKENEDLRQQNASLQEMVTRLTTQLEEKEKQLQDSSEKNRALESDLRVKTSEADRCRDLEQTINEKNAEIAEVKTKLEKREAEILKLTEERAAALSKAETSEKRITDLQTQLASNAQMAEKLSITNDKLHDKLMEALSRKNAKKTSEKEEGEASREKPLNDGVQEQKRTTSRQVSGANTKSLLA